MEKRRSCASKSTDKKAKEAKREMERKLGGNGILDIPTYPIIVNRRTWLLELPGALMFYADAGGVTGWTQVLFREGQGVEVTRRQDRILAEHPTLPLSATTNTQFRTFTDI